MKSSCTGLIGPATCITARDSSLTMKVRKTLRSFLEDFRDMEEDKLDSFPDALLDSPAGLLIEEHIGMLDERIDAIDEIESELESSFTGI